MQDTAHRSPIQTDRLEWLWWVFLLAAALPLWNISGLQVALDAAQAPRGIELQWARSLEDAQRIVGAWRALGLTDAVRSIQWWDFLLLLCYAAGLWGACRIGVRILREKLGDRVAKLVPWTPVTAAAFDAVENIATLQLLEGAPGTVWYAVALMVAAKLKWALLGFAVLFVLISWWALLIGRLTGKGLEERKFGGFPERASIAEVIDAELRVIAGKRPGDRAARPGSEAETEAYERAYAANLSGLAFSGGGIRSATFCLGILQALARAEKLSCFHYLSTVSGGGYIGSWLSAWINRRAGNTGHVESALQSPGRELAEISFLRSYSNYLTPRKGLFTVDTWTAVATYIRNLLLNLIILVGFVWALFALLMLVVFHHGSPEAWGVIASAAICVATAAMTIGVTYSADAGPASSFFGPRAVWLDLLRFFVHARRRDAWGAFGAALDGAAKLSFRQKKKLLPTVLRVRRILGSFAWLQSNSGVLALIVVPIFLAAFGGGIWAFAVLSGAFDESWMKPIQRLALAGFLCWALAFALASLLSERHTVWKAIAHVAAAIMLAIAAQQYAETHSLEWIDIIGAVLLAMAFFAVLGWSVSEFAAGQLGRLQGLVSVVYEFARFALAGTFGIVVLAAVVVFFSENVVLDWYREYTSGTIIPAEEFGRFDQLIRKLFAAIVEPPIVLAGIGAGVVCAIGLVGNIFSDRGREWWSRLGGWIMIVLIGWTVLVAIPLAVPGFMAWLKLMAGEGVGYVMSSGWAALTGVVTLFARGGLAAGKAGGAVRAAVAVAPYLFAGGVVVLLANGFYGIALRLNDLVTRENAVVPWVPSDGFAVSIVSGMVNLGGVSADTWLTFFAASSFVALLFALCVDINRFSLHDFYRNRLVRCYLGASNRARHERPGHVTDVDSFTGFSPSDDLPMSALLRNRPLFHIVNTALNIVKTSRLAWQERKAASFVFTPLYSGYALPDADGADPRKCFRLTSSYARSSEAADGVTLGTAMAISGAAVSPNMGRLTTPAFAALMTLLDLRLGCWMPNPGRKQVARLPSPPVAAQYLFYELLGLTDEKRRYVYLSDGGHFENLGVYELVRRRCRLILSIDAGADPERKFEDLGICIRKCQVDLGVRITLDVENLERRTDGTSAIAFAEGSIHYPEGEAGRLIYVKPSITQQSEALAQLNSFHGLHSDFPHQPTTDQWFDESQFESYRVLGELIGKLALHDVPDCREGGPKGDQSG